MKPGGSQTTKLLCVGDMHLGRVPSRLPDRLADFGLMVAELGPAAAWQKTVDAAIREGVDAVLLAGDVVEAEDDFYEAFSLLDAGVRRLLDAGIEVVAVAGNHDVLVLPRLADSLPDFKLLGRGGKWQEFSINAGVHILGWSFPTRAVYDSPLDSFPQLAEIAATRIGLMHCDLDAGNSPYAPVRGTQLRQTPVDAWLLGHVHIPSEFEAGRPIGYLGSLVGLDPSETGSHGPWLMSIDATGRIDMQQLPLAPLRWDILPVDVSSLAVVEDIPGTVSKAITDHQSAISAELGAARLVGCRIRLIGEAPIGLHDRAVEIQEGISDFRFERDGVVFFIQRIIDATRPRLDLEALSKGSEPPALLAQRLLVLDRGDGDSERRSMLAAAREDLQRLHAQPQWSALGDRPFSDAYLVELLVRSGRNALQDLLCQNQVVS